MAWALGVTIRGIGLATNFAMLLSAGILHPPITFVNPPLSISGKQTRKTISRDKRDSGNDQGSFHEMFPGVGVGVELGANLDNFVLQFVDAFVHLVALLQRLNL